jgi:riboflavin biosynthesis pyrimidine reductase
MTAEFLEPVGPRDPGDDPSAIFEVLPGTGHSAKFWHHGGDKLIYCPDTAVPKLREHLGDLADIKGLGAELGFPAMLDDLGARGIGRLMVEGGGTIHTQFLSAGLADEIHLAIAPIRFSGPLKKLPGLTKRGASGSPRKN